MPAKAYYDALTSEDVLGVEPTEQYPVERNRIARRGKTTPPFPRGVVAPADGPIPPHTSPKGATISSQKSLFKT